MRTLDAPETESVFAPAASIPRWGMTVDLNRCIGCQTCTIACKHANDTPPDIQWRRVLDVELGVFPDVERLFLVTGCQHCDNPPCVPVCPTGATFRRADGIVDIDYGLCIGCASCAVACPYQARHMVEQRDLYFGDRDTTQERSVAHPERLGVAQKCTFCAERIDAARARGQRPGIDLAATPACAASCITQALRFGDFNDPASPVSALLRDGKSFAMHEDLGTRPMIRYLYETPAIPGQAARPADRDDDRLRDLENPLTGKLQIRWDYRAAMNFILGGLGSGLAIVAAVAWAFFGLAPAMTGALFVAAGIVMAVGLTFVFFKIGRKLRFLYALRRPRTSWMSREVYAVGAFYALVGANVLWPGPLFPPLIGTAAAAFLYCQARILSASKGIPAWRAPLVPKMIVASGLLEGMGALIALLGAAATPVSPIAAALALIGLSALNAGLWHAYRTEAAASGIPPLARDRIAAITPWLHTVGHGIPAALGAAALAASVGQASALLAFAGLAACAGGALWKFTIITRAAYFQGFALPKLPRRGSGMRAATAGGA